MLKRLILVLATMTIAVPAVAEDEKAEEDKGPWAGKAALGYLSTSGNTENSNLNSAFELTHTTDRWKHLLRALAIYASEDEVTSSEAYELGWKSEWTINDASFLFGRLNWRKDRFSSYDSQFSQTAGYGRRLIETDRHKLHVEVGAGARQSRLVDGSREDEFIIRGGLDYVWVLSETAEFTQKLGVESGDTNTNIESVSALSARIMGNLALVASYTIKHNTDVLPLTEKTDTYTALSLEYLF